MKMVIFLPPGGPKFLPPRLSSSTSMEFWHMNGVVALEKLILGNGGVGESDNVLLHQMVYADAKTGRPDMNGST